MSTEDKSLLRILLANAVSGVEWSRPMDLGAWDGSGHSGRLKRLCEKGLVERKRRNSICNVLLNSARGSYEYRITDAGRVMLAKKASEHASELE